MGIFLPAMVLGGLGLGHVHASKELEVVVKDTTLFGFWWGAGIGVFFGVIIGAYWHPFFLKIFRCIDFFLGDGSEEK